MFLGLPNAKKIGVSARISQAFSHVLLASILFMAMISIYFLWSENKNAKDLHQESIRAIVSELTRQLAVPVKVGDIVGTHEIMATSVLSSKSDWITVQSESGDVLFSNQSEGQSCNGHYSSNKINYRSQSAGQISICLKKTDTSNSGIVLSVISIWVMFLTAIYFLGAIGKKATRQTRDLEEFINNIDPDKIEVPRVIHTDTELGPIYNQICLLLERIGRNRKKIQELEVYEALSKQARSVVHDIRSPLTLMKTILRYPDKIEKKDRELLDGAIQNIENISNELLCKSKSINDDKIEDTITLLSEFWIQKKVEFSSSGTQFVEDLNWNDISAIQDSIGLKRTLSNIVNNAVDAVSEKLDGTVKLKSYLSEELAFIEITDNGGGIDPEIAPNLGKREITSKKDGNGIGLLNAKKYIESISGKMKILTNSQGTSIQLSFPLTT